MEAPQADCNRACPPSESKESVSTADYQSQPQGGGPASVETQPDTCQTATQGEPGSNLVDTEESLEDPKRASFRSESGAMGEVMGGDNECKDESKYKLAVEGNESGANVPGLVKKEEDEVMLDVGIVKEERDEADGDASCEKKGDLDDVKEDPQELLQEFYAEVRHVDRGQEVERIMSAFKLNPFEQLNLSLGATLDEIRRQYRKLSLMVHPDKCQHERAREAFEALGEAQAFLLDDEKRTQLIFGLETAREEVRNEWKKATKHDSVVRVASILHEGGRAGVEAEYEETEDFNHKWKMKAREILAKTEWRKRKLAKRLKEEEERIEVEEKEEREIAKRKKEHDENWEKTRDTRVGTWRSYLNNKKGKKKGKGAKVHGELRPPKMKTNDEEKLYVQRPLGEQFRPQQKKK